MVQIASDLAVKVWVQGGRDYKYCNSNSAVRAGRRSQCISAVV